MQIRTDERERTSAVPFVDPQTHAPLEERGGELYSVSTGRKVGVVSDSIPRFVDVQANYAENFGLQWKEWHSTMSDARNTGRAKLDLIRERTKFAEYEMEGRTILECGMGGGDDTEVLLQFPFSEVHSFDISTSVERAREYLTDPRFILSQASIYEIPYPDRSFDFVFCHRVLQHTPDPVAALRCVCRKVKVGGVLFAHSYKRSWRYRMHYKYKYRWLTTRLSPETILNYVNRYGPFLFSIHNWARGQNRLHNKMISRVLRQWIPFHQKYEYGDLKGDQLLEMAKLCTFDALTPTYDLPMSTREFCGTIEEEGFKIDHFRDTKSSPIWCTARRL